MEDPNGMEVTSKEEITPIKSEPKNMNLVHYCIRALGEWQALDVGQYKLVNVEHNIKVLQPSGEFPMELEIHRLPETSFIDWESLSAPLLMKMKATRLTVAELDESDETPPFGPTEDNAIPDIQEIQNIRKFIAPKRTGKDLWLEHEGVINCDVVDALSAEQKAEYYWGLKLRHRSSTIVLGILKSIPELEKEGYENWILPTGDMIPLRDLQLGMFEVIPHQLWLVDVLRFFQVGATVLDLEPPVMVPTVVLDSTIHKKIFVREVHAELGPVVMQYILEATLPDGSTLVIDPTARQYGYKGPHGTLIVHGEWTKYIQNFPGIVGDKITSTPHLYFEAYFLGNSRHHFIQRLASCLIKYLERTMCNYCGQIQGYHPERVRKDMRYKFEPTELINCPCCKLVSYCGTFCQKWDWKQHRLGCEKIETYSKFGF